MALDHVGIFCRDYERSVKFYEDVLQALGNKKKMSVECEHGRGTGFGKMQPTFWVHGAGENDAGNTRPATTTHIAFAASSKSAVDKFYHAAIAAGAKCNGKPGFRSYHPFYYAAFVIDPEGNNIEAVNHFDMYDWKVGVPLVVVGLAICWAILTKAPLW